MNRYNPAKTEAKWQKFWQAKKVFAAKENSKKRKKFILVEFPYPSGAGLHMGHLRPYVAGDVYSRYLRMQGHEVMYPIGWDAFGLPAENYAIKLGVHPAITTKKNVANAKKQMLSWGLSFDWAREVNTTDPEYYKWTQWLFLQFYKAGLAYEATGLINWCPKDKTGLANEEVVDGKCERCGSLVVKKELRQWYLKITAYAEKLLQGLKSLPEWPEAVKLQQENWIGRSVGAEIDFPVANNYNYVILHGFKSGPERAYGPWLKAELEKRGCRVAMPQLPNTGEPQEEEQVNHVLQNCSFDKNTILLGRSLGAVVAMKVVEKLGQKIAGLVLAGGFAEPVFIDQPRPFAKTFSWEFDYKKIQKQAGFIKVLSDLKDYAVSPEQGVGLASKLGAELVEVVSEKPHFGGDREPSIMQALTPAIKVFTTRPDTLYGATYMVVAPEHPLVKANEHRVENVSEVRAYVELAKKRKEIERAAEGKEKTGVELKGIKAVNPATGREIPVWVADYVLWGYGTGAIMAVPAHDSRDFEFARKFALPVRQVVLPAFVSDEDPPKPDQPFVPRNATVAVVRNPQTDEYLCLAWKVSERWRTFVTGGIEPGESAADAARREIAEETGYKNLRLVKELAFAAEEKFYHLLKKENRQAVFRGLVFELKDDTRQPVAEAEAEKHAPVWVKKEQVGEFVSGEVFKYFWQQWLVGEQAFEGQGKLTGSAGFDGQDSAEAAGKIAETFGKPTVQYKLRDWVFSRQRYWGEPIPLVHCPNCGVVPVPDKDLPVRLPAVKKYEPTGTGESPLAAIAKWVNIRCPKCKSPARRETNTMPQWAGSSWYWLRYADPDNKSKFADRKKLKYWQPVDVYFGGMEHTTLHLLYSRFWNLFLYDQGLVTEKEPYKKRQPHGIVLAADGEKMSKSRGNVVDPQVIVKKYGADTLRMYELFLGPHELMVSWNDQGVVGVRRFLDRVWLWAQRISLAGKKPQSSAKAEKALHRLIKKVTEDVENFRFNTAISAFMEFHNQIKDEPVSPGFAKTFLKLLYPFAPHLAEELGWQLGGRKSLQTEAWPGFDAALLVEQESEIVVQVNGKVRGKVPVPAGALEAEVQLRARSLAAVKQALAGGSVKRTIFILDKLINFVV